MAEDDLIGRANIRTANSSERTKRIMRICVSSSYVISFVFSGPSQNLDFTPTASNGPTQDSVPAISFLGGLKRTFGKCGREGEANSGTLGARQNTGCRGNSL